MTATASKKILTPKLEEASKLQNAGDNDRAIQVYSEILSVESTDENVLREQELALMSLGELYRDLQ
jgi:26S proteasome regulatory subunit N6